jgi:hypothetical protein
LGSAALRIRGRLLPLIAENRCWLASRGTLGTSFLRRLSDHIADQLHPGERPRMEWLKYQVSRREVLTCEMRAADAGTPLIVKIPLSA